MNSLEIRRFRMYERIWWEQAYAIRTKVFVEEQHVPEELEQDEHDRTADHVLAVADGVTVGTGRYVKIDGKPKVGRIAVLKEHRGKGYGAAIVNELCAIAKARGNTEVHLGSQVQVIPFYETLGFEAYGDEFMDAGIPHRMMGKKLE